MTVTDKLARSGPRKSLALDGGGIRGLITIEVLAEIERPPQEEPGARRRFRARRLLRLHRRHEHGRGHRDGPRVGMSGRPDPRFYLENAVDMFDKSRLLDRFRFKYEDDRLAARLRRELGEETTLGSDQLRTLLLVVMRNATTNSPGPSPTTRRR